MEAERSLEEKKCFCLYLLKLQHQFVSVLSAERDAAQSTCSAEVHLFISIKSGLRGRHLALEQRVDLFPVAETVRLHECCYLTDFPFIVVQNAFYTVSHSVFLKYVSGAVKYLLVLVFMWVCPCCCCCSNCRFIPNKT